MTSVRNRAAENLRATLLVLLGLPVALGAGTVIAGLLLLWGAAILSLLGGPGGNWVLIVGYVLMAVAGPVLLLWTARAFAALHRARFRAVLGVDLPAPAPVAAKGPRRLVEPWRTASTWRQLCYHLIAPVIGVGGSAIVVLTALLAARWVARIDTRAAQALLGPSRTDELAQRVESLARSRADIVAATDAERRRIERDLHDGAQQRLVSLAMNLGMARANLTDLPGPAREAIEQAHDEATQALAELRQFVRGLHPAVLDDRGLDAALSGIVARAPLPVRLTVDVPRRCSPSIEAIAYFVVSEALANTAKHAHASRAEVTVRRTGDRLRIVVTDDGRGGAKAGGGDGSGLRGLAQRAAAVDGTLAIDSPPGGPTTITVELPCES
jgi:signal transduction histidine kinase